MLAPKLQSVDSAVIIRRGDTLWRISRRVYGRGIRYSTIYLANEKQIEDPDRIWPGQVFKVPEKSNDGKADAEFVRTTTGFAIGGVAPVGHASAVTTLVDASLADHETVWAAAGHPHTVFPTTHDELVRITGGRSVTVRPPA